jgi:hypothetical protein
MVVARGTVLTPRSVMPCMRAENVVVSRSRPASSVGRSTTIGEAADEASLVVIGRLADGAAAPLR